MPLDPHREVLRIELHRRVEAMRERTRGLNIPYVAAMSEAVGDWLKKQAGAKLKECKTCGKLKPTSKFYPNRGTRSGDGFRPSCSACTARHQRSKRHEREAALAVQSSDCGVAQPGRAPES